MLDVYLAREVEGLSYQYIGQSQVRSDGIEKVTGRAGYVYNMEIPNMVHAKVVRSLVPHGRVKSIDVSKATKLPGVLLVFTRDDVDAGIYPFFGPVVNDQAVVAIDKVRYVGDIVAAVVAEDPRIAEEAADLVEVEYEELPAVFDAEEAVRPDAPLVHEKLNLPPWGFSDVRATLHPIDGTNIVNHFRVRRGNVEQGFAEADYIFQDTYRLPAVQHCPLEPHATIARYESDGSITVWSNTQTPFLVQAQVAQTLGIPQSRVRITVPFLGGGFGAKTYPKLEPLVAVLALKTGRPVKLSLTREEEFITITRHAATVTIKTGVKRDGTITARQTKILWNTGAYADIGPRLSKNGGYASVGPYRIPNVWVDSYCVYTNMPPAGALRGYGVPQVSLAYETQMDRIARELGFDPVEYRLKLALDEGDSFATGDIIHSAGFRELLRRAAQAIDWKDKSYKQLRGSTVRGKGIACTIKSTITPSTSSAEVKMFEDGSISLLTSTVEMGQGSDTALAQIAAEALSIPVESIRVQHPDTFVTPYDLTTSSSRSIYHMGNAILLAAEDAKRQLRDRAAEIMRVSPESLEVRDGRIVSKTDHRYGIPFGEAVKGVGPSHGSIIGHGLFSTVGGLDPETGQGKASEFWFAACGAAEVEVDTETGKVRVTKYYASSDAGKAINPVACEQQNEGSAINGLGHTLFEQMLFDNGQPINNTFLDYKIPSFLDLPHDLVTEVVETPHRNGPFGAKGMGETAISPVAPAIANAIADAVGVWVTELPVTPERVLQALQEQNLKHDGAGEGNQ